MVIEIVKDPQEEGEQKLVVLCKLCNKNFTPGPYECPYLYHPELGLHIPLCALCRETLKKEDADSQF